MLSPQVVSAESSNLFSLLAVLANPAEMKKQLQALKEAADNAISSAEDAAQKRVEASQKTQELNVLEIELTQRKREWEFSEQLAKSEIDSRVRAAGELEARAKVVLAEAEAKATELLSTANNHVVEMEKATLVAAEKLSALEEKGRFAATRLAETEKALLALSRRLAI